MSDRLPFTCPTVPVTITTPTAWRDMARGQLALPLGTSQQGMGIIDTGAERSVIRAELCDQLRLPRSQAVSLRGVTAPGRTPKRAHRLTAIRQAEVTIQGHVFLVDALAANVADDHALMLIGMDIIRLGRLVLDGPRGILSLEFPSLAARRPQARSEPEVGPAQVAIHRAR